MVNTSLLDIFSQLICDQQMGAETLHGSSCPCMSFNYSQRYWYLHPHMDVCVAGRERSCLLPEQRTGLVLVQMSPIIWSERNLRFSKLGVLQLWFKFPVYAAYTWAPVSLPVAKEARRTGKQDASAARYAWADPVHTSSVSVHEAVAGYFISFFFFDNNLEQGAFLEDPKTYRR